MVKFKLFFLFSILTAFISCTNQTNTETSNEVDINQLELDKNQSESLSSFYNSLAHQNDLEKMGLIGSVREIKDSTKLKATHLVFSEDGMIISETIIYANGSVYRANEHNRQELIHDDESGWLIRINTFYEDELTHYERFNYAFHDSIGSKIVMRYDIEDNLLSTTTTEYNNDLQIVEIRNSDILGSETLTKFIYSANNMLESEILTEKSSGKVLQSIDYRAKYDSLGNWLISEVIAFDDTTNTKRTILYYP